MLPRSADGGSPKRLPPRTRPYHAGQRQVGSGGRKRAASPHDTTRRTYGSIDDREGSGRMMSTTQAAACSIEKKIRARGRTSRDMGMPTVSTSRSPRSIPILCRGEVHQLSSLTNPDVPTCHTVSGHIHIKGRIAMPAWLIPDGFLPDDDAGEPRGPVPAQPDQQGRDSRADHLHTPGTTMRRVRRGPRRAAIAGHDGVRQNPLIQEGY